MPPAARHQKKKYDLSQIEAAREVFIQSCCSYFLENLHNSGFLDNLDAELV